MNATARRRPMNGFREASNWSPYTVDARERSVIVSLGGSQRSVGASARRGVSDQRPTDLIERTGIVDFAGRVRESAGRVRESAGRVRESMSTVDSLARRRVRSTARFPATNRTNCLPVEAFPHLNERMMMTRQTLPLD